MQLILSLFDYTGLMVEPWTYAGYETITVDNQKDGPSTASHVLNIDLLDTAALIEAVDKLGVPSILFGFPPCTDLAVCGSRSFASKAEKDPLFQEKAVALARSVETIGSHYGVPWMLENPVSVLSTKWRKPNFIFDPYQYGGYLPEDDEHPLYPKYIAPRDAYTKKTCLWTGNGFTMPEKRPVPVPPGYSKQYSQLGGKSLKTKNIRSATPRGFAQAVFEHYKDKV